VCGVCLALPCINIIINNITVNECLSKIILPFHMLEQIPMPLQYPPAEGSSGKFLARGVQIVDHVSEGFQFAALKKIKMIH